MIQQTKENTPRSIQIIIVCLILLFFILTFSGGYFLGIIQGKAETYSTKSTINISNKKPESNINNIDFSQFWQVWENINKNYVNQPVNEKEMFYGAIAGITASLQDPYSVFLDPELTKGFNEDISGIFSGIGIEIGIRENHIVVIAPLPDTPAANAGLKASDVILAIDQLDTTNMNLDYAVNLIRGEKGTPVKLLIQRNDQEPQEYAITRDIITVDSVEWEIKELNGKKIYYINITNFNNDTSIKLQEVVNSISLNRSDGIILDLRNNPGGLFDQSIEVSSLFVSNGVIVSEQFNKGEKKDYSAKGHAPLAGIKTIVLVNEGSASAAEIVAGALQDYGAGILIGTKTFGKGSVQNFEEFADGSSLKLTIAHWLTPKGNSIDEKGITPNEIVELTDDDYLNNRDPQLNRALEILGNN